MTTKFALLLIRAYKIFISPIFTGACRFSPSCSDYAAEAIARHGPARGSWLTIRRLAKCHPLGPSGFDPVPSAEMSRDGRRTEWGVGAPHD